MPSSGSLAAPLGNADTAPRTSAVRTEFEDRGYLGPLRVLTADECRRFLWSVSGDRSPPAVDWDKSMGTNSRAYFDLARHPEILDRVEELIGGDVMLWGACLVVREPGAIHPWHSDIESSTCGGRTVSVWLGLEHTTRDSALLVLPHTHTLGATIQEVQHREGKNRHETSEADLLRWAQAHDARSVLVRPEMTDGDAIFFDGRLWHGSNNLHQGTRVAVLLQYATPDAEIRIPDFTRLYWPFQKFEVPRPPCVMLRGKSQPATNRLVAGPVARESGPGPLLTSRIHPLRVPLAPDGKDGWKPYFLFHGYTADLHYLICHVSALAPGRSPHPPHGHDEEEILLLLSGEADLIFTTSPAGTDSQRVRMRPGEFNYYPAGFAHTIAAVGETPANYLMFKWHNPGVIPGGPPLPHGRYDGALGDAAVDAMPGFRLRHVFEGPTTHLHRLQCHVSSLAPGAGYAPHVDAYDVAMVVLEGEIETLGGRARAHDVVFCRAGEAHGMRNPGTVPARYLVIEFQGRARPPSAAVHEKLTAFLNKVTDPKRWKRKLRHIVSRVRRRTG